MPPGLSAPERRMDLAHSPREAVPARFNLARYCLSENARTQPDRIGLTIVGDAGALQLSYARSTRRCAGSPLACGRSGLPRGARVMIRMGNEANAALAYFAAIAAGYVALIASSQLTFEEAEFLRADSAASALLLGAEFEREPHAADSFSTLRPDTLSRLFETEPLADYEDTGRDEPAYLVYTSGTTSRPKGVLHAHRAAFARRLMYPHWMGLTSADTMLHAGAINWTYTLGVGIVDPFACGAEAVLYNGKPDASIWARLIEERRATIFAAVPGVYRQILKHGAPETHDLSSLRHGLSAGAALSPQLLAEWRARTGKEIFEAYGMSEISTFVSSGPTTPVHPGSPGRPQPGRIVAALPRDGGTEPVPCGEPGLLAVREDEPGLMLRYWNRDEEEREARRGEWFVSGDLVSFDADGYVHLQGRADEVMNAGGYRVSPAEVERCLLAHPDVAEAAVAERPGREEGTSIIKAYVVLRDGRDPQESDLLGYCAEHLAAYKRPRAVVRLDHLPRNANGKLMRAALP